MSWLAIDTSAKHLTVIVNNGGKIFKHYEADCGVKHSVALMPAVEKLANEANFDISSADFIACVVGAGSFTGIRIGVATVKALCLAYKIPAVNITSFDTLAYNVKGERIAVIDAGHGGYYVCGYGADDKINLPPEYALTDRVKALTEGKTVVSYSVIEQFGAQAVSAADGLIAAVNAKKGEACPPDGLIPLYIRKSQAEEGR